MIEEKIDYERNLTGSYMKISAINSDKFDEKIVLNRKLPGLLPVEKCFYDGEGQFWYNISGKQSLDNYCEIKEIGIDFIEKVIVSICSQIEILESNLICSNCLILQEDLIFISNTSQEIIFGVYTGKKDNIENEFRQLMEYLLTKIDHSDKAAVKAAYSIYEKTLNEGYSVIDIRNAISNAKNENAREENKKRIVDEGVKEEPVFKAPAKYSEGMSEKRQVEAPAEKQIKNKLSVLFEKIKSILKMTPDSIGKEKKKEEFIINPNDEFPDEKDEMKTVEIHPTVCLSNYVKKPQGMLIYEGKDSLENIVLEDTEVKVGQGYESNVRINRETISNYHAKITGENGDYYIEDMNSTNGTFVNDEPLEYRKKRKLCINDSVSFADIRYRFI